MDRLGLVPARPVNVPPPLLYDLSKVDLQQIIFTREQIYDRLPQRFEFMQLNGVIHVDRDAKVAIAYRDVREDEWWVRGHVPGRPIFPGILMLETGAQLAAFVTAILRDYTGFVGFGGVDDCKFRGAVTPPARIYMICHLTESRARRIKGDCQAVVDEAVVFEAQITGLQIPGAAGD
ncbi:MAG: 3-hydroxyacyl-ACP dehydratase FabZ family protein [Planctomycetota bacterium]